MWSDPSKHYFNLWECQLWVLVVSAICAAWAPLADSIAQWCNKTHYDVSGQEVISACLTQGKDDIHHPHVKPSSHLGSGNLDPNVTPHPKQWQEYRTDTPCHWDQLLSRVLHLQCRLLTQSRPLLSGYLGTWGSVPSALGTPHPSPLRCPPLCFLPSFSIRKLIHTQISSFHHLMCILLTAISLLC